MQDFNDDSQSVNIRLSLMGLINLIISAFFKCDRNKNLKHFSREECMEIYVKSNYFIHYRTCGTADSFIVPLHFPSSAHTISQS